VFLVLFGGWFFRTLLFRGDSCLMPPPQVLLLSADPAVVQTVREVSSLCGLSSSVCTEPEAAVLRLQETAFMALLVHVLNPEDTQKVLPLLWAINNAKQTCATVVLVNSPNDEQLAALLRAGATDCIEGPLDRARLARVLQDIQGLNSSAASLDVPEKPEEDLTCAFFEAFSPGMAGMADQLRRVAPQDATVLLTGETGTGKTRLARLIHQLSPRRGEPFLVVDCGALSSGLVESELFGHARGAFTGADRERAGKLAAAGSGTLLLDEVNSLPPPLQGKLLRAVDERVFEPVGSDRPRQVKARLIAASNAPLEREVEAGRFRADLYHRLNVVGFFLPPLRDRRPSIAPLACRFLKELASRNRADVTGLSSSAMQALERYHWPGNVRELRNVIDRAVALCPGPRINLDDLPDVIRTAASTSPHPLPAEDDPFFPLPPGEDEEERELILRALRKHNNKRRAAAEELGISRMGLYNKLQKHGLGELASSGPASGL